MLCFRLMFEPGRNLVQVREMALGQAADLISPLEEGSPRNNTPTQPLNGRRHCHKHGATCSDFAETLKEHRASCNW